MLRGVPSSDLLRLEVINEHIASVARADPDAWFIYADVDEHYVYSGPTIAAKGLRDAAEAPDCFWGLMCDMASADGTLSDVRGLDVPIEEQVSHFGT